MTKLKICGLTNQKDVSQADIGADAIGFIFYKKSPRYVDPELVKTIYSHPFTKRVGVFVNHSKKEISDICEQCNIDLIQLHGDESAEFCSYFKGRVIKAIRIDDELSLSQIKPYVGIVEAVLLDTKTKSEYGGTGKSFNWDLAVKAKEYKIPIILSGGLTPNNIKEAIQKVQPSAVDLSSGVELEPGKKDYKKINEVMNNVKIY
jgi:phosphoribosylanthranilate isomerase